MTLRLAARCVWRLSAVLVLTVTGVSAQTPYSSALTGTVRDATDLAVRGANVTITAPSLIGGAQTTATDVDGTYRFTLLPAGLYTIDVRADGLQGRRTEVRIGSGTTATFDFSLGVAGVVDAVEVRGSPVVDVTNAAVPVRLDDDLLKNLPTPRSIEGLINLAPGISSSVAFGGSQKGNEILLDGVRMTEPLFQDPILRGNYNWIQEINVVALGAAAEYGGFTGAAAYGVLRSGSNRFSGLGEFWTTQPGWLASNTTELSASLQKQFLSREILDWRDLSAQLGGPILRDRLWFFSGLQHARHNDRPAGFSGEGSRDERERQVIVKPTLSVSRALRVDGFVNGGRRSVDGEYIGPVTPLEASNTVIQPQVSWNANASWTIDTGTVAEIRQGGYDSYNRADPRPPGTREGPAPHYDYGTGVTSGNAYDYFEQDSRVLTTAVTVSHYREGLLGRSHQLKIGAEHERTRARQEYGYPGGRIYWDYFGTPSELSVWSGQAGNASTSRRVIFAQDTWRLSSRITVSPGLRLEWNRGSVPTQQNVFSTQTTAPRLGVAWDLTADHRTVARAQYGHYYDAIFASRIMSDDDSEQSPEVYYQIVGPDQLVELSRSSSQDRFAIDPDLQHSHVKQLVIGLEREVLNDVSVQAQYIGRRFDTFMGLIDTGSIYTPVQLRDPGPDGVRNTSDDGALLDVFNLTNPGNAFNLYTNPDAAYNRYHAFQVVARKRYSRDWQMQSSYTWSRNHGTVGNRWHVNAARFDLGNPGRFVNPNTNINADGRATYDPTHEVKVLGSRRLPWWGGTMVSGVYRYLTGQAWGRVAAIQGFAQGQQRIRIEPQGTRRAPAINRLDLRVEKTGQLPRVGTLGLFFDIFNVWNQGVPNSDAGDAINAVSGPRFGEPTTWVDPRMLRVGVRLSF